MVDVQLFLGDCLEVMPTLPDGCADIILADLPYGTTACAWDVVIPFEPLWAQYRRLLKPRGAVVLFGSQPFTTLLIASNREWFKYTWVWKKNRFTNFFNVKYQPGKEHEDIVIFSPMAASYSPRGVMTYNPQMADGAAWTRRDTGRQGKHMFHGDKPPKMRASGGGRYPTTVLEFPCEYDWHPTQKPVALLEYLIRTYTNEGETVLDNTMGSGTTGVACVQTGRNFIGIEIEKQYYDIAERRIREAQQQPALAL